MNAGQHKRAVIELYMTEATTTVSECIDPHDWPKDGVEYRAVVEQLIAQARGFA
jgi:hypothetical protein